MIDLEKILKHLDKKIEECRKALYSIDTKMRANIFIERIKFLQSLREALTIEEKDEDN